MLYYTIESLQYYSFLTSVSQSSLWLNLGEYIYGICISCNVYKCMYFLKHQTHELTSFSRSERQQEINQSIITAAIEIIWTSGAKTFINLVNLKILSVGQ